MGLWTMTGKCDGEPHAILVDSVTMRPLNLPLFADEDDVEAFLRFAAKQGVPNGDVRRLDDGKMNALHSRWLRSRDGEIDEERATLDSEGP